MAVDAAVRAEAEQMQGGVVDLAVVHSLQERGILEEISVLDGLGDPRQLLIHDAACADVQVAHLAVAHLAPGQAHVHAAGAQERVGAGVPQVHEVNRAVGQDGVIFLLLPIAEAVEDDQCGDGLHQ